MNTIRRAGSTLIGQKGTERSTWHVCDRRLARLPNRQAGIVLDYTRAAIST